MTAPADDDWADPAPLPPAARRKPPEPVRGETERTQDVIKWLRAQSGTWAFKKHTGPQGEAGHPDIFACRNGRMVLIEMKVPGDRPTKLQAQRLRTWREAGAAVCWATEVDHVKELFARMDADPAYRNPLTRPGAPA